MKTQKTIDRKLLTHSRIFLGSIHLNYPLQILIPEQSPKPRVHITTVPSEPSCLSLPKSPASSSMEVIDLASRRLTPTLTITVPSSEELRSVSSPESVSPQTSSQQHLDSNSTDERSPSDDPDFRERRRSANAVGAAKTVLQRQNSKWNKVKKAFLTSASSVPPSPSRTSSFFDGEFNFLKG